MFENILEVLKKYEESFPEDKDLKEFLFFLSSPENQGEKCVDRKNFKGHITVSALVVKEKKVLLLWHKTFNRLMQPGGHVDPPDKNIFEAVIREVREETGLDVEPDKTFSRGIFSEMPISLDKHEISKNEKKQEEAHFHYDMYFCLKLKDVNQEIKNEDDGVENAQWVDIENINETSNTVTHKAVSKYKQFL
jgi:8-oxo-dGTP pyrophosphatase MutT (NUDIX family)